MFIRKLIIILSAFALLSGTACSSKDDKKKPEVELSQAENHEKDLEKAQELYDRGIYLMTKKRYGEAKETLDEIEKNYPYSKLSAKSQILITFINYVEKDYEDVIRKVDPFIKLNPVNPNTPYMYYLKAISYYEMTVSPYKDQSISKDAYMSLNSVIERFPESEYAEDAKKKLQVVASNLVIHELEIGKKYLFDKNFVAAIKRFTNVITLYPDLTRYQPEAYYRMMESYVALGLDEQAKGIVEYMRQEFSNSKWTRYAAELSNQYL